MAALTVLHITDNHLYADAAHENDGLLPAATCAEVLRAAAAELPAPDAVLLTGDFTNDDSEASYRLMRRLVRAAFPEPTPVLFVPGNHEDLAALQRVFAPDFCGPSADQPVAQAALGPGWRALLLSTFAGPGCVHGALSPAALAALQAGLAAAAAAGESVLLALHHPPLPPAGQAPPWAGNCLREPEGLLELLQAHGCARVALYGHLHADTSAVLGAACHAYCTPSTCTQTRLQSPGWERDEAALPGYRVVRLLPDGSHETRVVRVDVGAVTAPP